MNRCPTCRTDLERFFRPLPNGSVADTEMCLDCGGLWLDQACLESTFPELLHGMSSLERREADAATRVCPFCEVDMAGFLLEGLTLDACDRCSGVWVDSHEIQPLDAARAAVIARGDLVPIATYRQAPVEIASLRTDVTRACEACAKSFDELRLVETNDGRRICRVCFEIESEPLKVPRTVFGHLLRWARVVR